MKIQDVLAHHAGARLYCHQTGRYPSPEELALFVQRGGKLAMYGGQGDEAIAQRVLVEIQRHGCSLGQVYQRLRDKKEKKGLGQVFTPPAAVEAILHLVEGDAHNILDPACGAGDFILSAARRWPGARLQGVDIDPLALAVTSTRLDLQGISAQLVQADVLCADLPSFDLVLGNPPWGSKLPGSRLKNYQFVRRRPLNSFVYFLELAARVLVPGGMLAFILPEAFIKVWGYRDVREWFLENFTPTAMHYIPNLFSTYYAPALLMVARRHPVDQIAPVPVLYQRDLKATARLYNTLPAQALGPERFNINWHRGMEEVWDQCSSNALSLQEGDLGAPLPVGEAVVDFSLGIVTGDNSRFVQEHQGAGCLPLLRASDVTPFKIQPPSHYMHYNPQQLQQVAPLEKYQAEAKIVYRFIAREIIAAVDYSGALTLNNLNIIVPLRLPFSLDYLVVLLNSRLLNTLYMYRFFTGKVLTRHIKQLPLRVPGREEAEICRLVRDTNRHQEKLNYLVYQLYGLNQDQRQLVEEQYQALRKIFFV